MKEKITLYLERTSVAILGHPLTPPMREFIRHLSWSFFGGIIASALLLTVNVFAGRWLGPSEYGKYSVIWSIAQIMVVFILFSMDVSALRAVSSETNEDRKNKNISSVFFFCLLSAVFFSIVYAFIITHTHFKIETRLLWYTLMLGLALSFRQVSDSFMRILAAFKAQSFVRIMEASLILGLFLVLVKGYDVVDYRSYILALAGGAIFVVAICSFYFAKRLTSFSKETLWERFGYAKLFFIATALGMLFASLDKLVLARYVSFNDVGVYSAYYTASFVLAAQLMTFFDNVFFPTMSRLREQMHDIIWRVDKLMLRLFLPFFLVMSLAIFVLITLFGKNYQVTAPLVFSFAILAVLKVALSINASMVAVYSEQSLKWSIFLGNGVNVLFIVLYIFFLPYINISIQSMANLLILYHVLLFMVVKFIFFKLGLYTK